MYNATIHAHQTMHGTLLLVSASETDDSRRTESIFTTHARSEAQFQSLDAYSLEEFLEQIIDGVVKALSSTEYGSIATPRNVDQSTVGGGAPRHPSSADEGGTDD